MNRTHVRKPSASGVYVDSRFILLLSRPWAGPRRRGRSDGRSKRGDERLQTEDERRGKWWRRWELNPRPETLSLRRLRR